MPHPYSRVHKKEREREAFLIKTLVGVVGCQPLAADFVLEYLRRGAEPRAVRLAVGARLGPVHAPAAGEAVRTGAALKGSAGL